MDIIVDDRFRSGYLIERMFENRGYTREFLSGINSPSVNTLADIDKACDLLYQLRQSGGRIVEMPDFDMDGVASGLVSFAGLCELGFNVSLYIPEVKDGYGFTDKTVDKVLAKYPDTAAIITSDMGISCHRGVAAAKRRGIIVIVTDHHEPDYDKYGIPEADAVVDPKRRDDTYEHSNICGAYVVYQVLERYVYKYGTVFELEQIRRLRVFAGLGTVSDGMPMLYENRKLTSDAVNIARLIFCSGNDFMVTHINGHPVYRRAFMGLYELFRRYMQLGKISSPSDIDEDFFGYYVAPLFNSVKRMEGDMNNVFGVFFGQNPEADLDVLFDLNEARKALVAEKFKELLAGVQDGNSVNHVAIEDEPEPVALITYEEKLQGKEGIYAQPLAPYIWFSDVHKGVLGLLAQKVRDYTGLPCLVLNPALDYSGSGRAPGWYPFLPKVKSYILAQTDGLKRFCGGHVPSFGAGLGSMESVREFHDFMCRDVPDAMSKLTEAEREARYDFVIDALGKPGCDIHIDILSFYEYISEIKRYAPFGPGFEAPNIMFRFYPREMGDDVEYIKFGSMKQHLKMRFAYGFEVIVWNCAHMVDDIRQMQECSLAGTLGLNVYMDRYTVVFTGSVLDADGQ